jgi:hypothetical protein
MRAVFLVGANHQYQVGPNGIIPVDVTAEAFSKFRDFLKTVIKRHNICGVAEEMSLYTLRKRQHVLHGGSVPFELSAEICCISCYQLLPILVCTKVHVRTAFTWETAICTVSSIGRASDS